MIDNSRKIKIENVNTGEVFKFESIKKANVFLFKGNRNGTNKILRHLSNRKLINEIYKLNYIEKISNEK